MRMDIEGVEYDTLTDLAVSGIGQSMELYLTLEWHKGAKANALGGRELAFMRMLDHRFGRYPFRCGDGSCGFGTRVDNSTMEGGLEKFLAFMLHRAGITYADAFFDVSNGRKALSAQSWEFTRERRARIGSSNSTLRSDHKQAR